MERLRPEAWPLQLFRNLCIQMAGLHSSKWSIHVEHASRRLHIVRGGQSHTKRQNGQRADLRQVRRFTSAGHTCGAGRTALRCRGRPWRTAGGGGFLGVLVRALPHDGSCLSRRCGHACAGCAFCQDRHRTAPEPRCAIGNPVHPHDGAFQGWSRGGARVRRHGCAIHRSLGQAECIKCIGSRSEAFIRFRRRIL